MDEKAEFAARLRQALINAGHEPRPVILEKGFNARYWGRSVSFQAVSRWLRGEAIPSQEKLQVLAEWLGVEPQVLRFGEGVATSVRARRKRWDEGVGYLEREVFEAFMSLPPERRKLLREVILTFARAEQATKGKDGG